MTSDQVWEPYSKKDFAEREEEATTRTISLLSAVKEKTIAQGSQRRASSSSQEDG
jgi:hypothetical protein